jgi:hypothetical protein
MLELKVTAESLLLAVFAAETQTPQTSSRRINSPDAVKSKTIARVPRLELRHSKWESVTTRNLQSTQNHLNQSSVT